MKKDMLKVLFILIVASAVCVAGDDSKTGTAGAEELLLPVGGRSTALSGSTVATVEGIDAIQWNPAGLAQIAGSGEAMFSHMNYFADIGVDYGAIGFSSEGVGSFALSIKALNFGDIQQTTEELPEGTGATFSPAFDVFGLTYARQLTDRISVGFSAKYVSEKIIRTSADGFAFDAGVKYIFGAETPLTGLKLGVAVKNLGGQMQYSGPDLEEDMVPQNSAAGAQAVPMQFVAQSFELPSTIELALGYDIHLNTDNHFIVTADFENNNFGSDAYRFGGEYAFNQLFFARVGYTYSPLASSSTSSTIFGLTAGAGASVDLGGVRAELDYAYGHTQYFSGINTLSLLIGF